MSASELDAAAAAARVRARFESAAVPVVAIETREYPEETIIVVRVPPTQYESAVSVGNALDSVLQDEGFRGFVTVRKQETDQSDDKNEETRKSGVGDEHATKLANVLTARSRTSEVQPSLAYIRDSANTLSAIVEARNHLVFGRRGAGKTALLVEAKKVLEHRQDLVAWMNVQTIRNEGAHRAFVWAGRSVLDTILIRLRGVNTRFLEEAHAASDELQMLLSNSNADVSREAQRFVPKLQRIVNRSLQSVGARLFLFVDDLHYLRRDEQPQFLDLLHGSFRDTDAWLKVASIRHLTKWFQPHPPLGLQSGHDAAHIDLDLTLEAPREAKAFLDRVLDTYAEFVGIKSARKVFSDEALDRLVLASGAVPRDYLELAATSVREAKRRAKARLVGVQDVNGAAGQQSKVKLQELEEDAASALPGSAQRIVAALNTVREFCLETKRITFFRVDFRDKENRPEEYALVQALLDVRIVHLIHQGLSDGHEAGRRSEVFMLDLSQFSGQRFKKHLSVLDLSGGHLTLKKTGVRAVARSGDTFLRLQAILRRGPILELALLSSGTDVGVKIAQDVAADELIGRRKAASSRTRS